MGKKSRHQKGSEFLTDDCGQNALQLAARGSAIIAEMLRLSEYVPDVFSSPERHPQYYNIIFTDYTYFRDPDAFEKFIQDSAELLQRDDDFKATHLELLERFFKLFRGVYGYAQELNRFIDEIKEGLYISHTLESILVNQDGKQLLCEIYHLYGVMLLLLDHRIGGRTREFLIVSYIRYRGSGEQHTVEIADMCRNTGYAGKDQPLPKRYPVAYFNRVKVDKSVIAMLIGRLTSDDVYQMAYNYPAPEHRSAALAQQAAILYVLLFFKPEILQERRQDMQEIVNKHFTDNWVISYYMGFTVDLTVAWQHFPAANAVISTVACIENVSYYQKRHRENLKAVNQAIAGYLREGVLTEQFTLDSIHTTLLPCVRDANVTLRWFILHMTRGPPGRRILDKYKPVYDLVLSGVDVNDILTLLLQTAQLEFKIKEMFEKFLKEKPHKWTVVREQCVRKMTKLAEYFSGEHVLSDNVRVAALETWFSDIASRVESLEFNEGNSASRKIQKLMMALEQVLEFHQIDSNLQVVQFIQDTRGLLRQMIRYINIETKVLITLATVGDISYAWELMSYHGCFVSQIQDKIKKNPHLAIQMRSTFVKLATMLELPLTRIDQAAGNDALLTASLESVSEYYSTELVTFVRHVLHIIPSSIFKVMRDIIRILVEELKECPTKVVRKDLKEQSQLEVRHRLSSLTTDIANYANGVLAMETTRIGVLDVNPHQLLEDGIRKELTRQITYELHNAIPFDPIKKPLTGAEFDGVLQQLTKRLHGIRRAFEYIQDYINVHGLRLWIEEFSRIVGFTVEMECNAFMQKKLYPWNSQYQSESIPIPYFPPEHEGATYSFLGKIVRNLLAMTDPSHATFIPSFRSWFDKSTLTEVVGSRTFDALSEAIGSPGLASLDRLICFIIAKDVQMSIIRLRFQSEEVSTTLQVMKKALTPDTAVPIDTVPLYERLLQELSTLSTKKTLQHKHSGKGSKNNLNTSAKNNEGNSGGGNKNYISNNTFQYVIDTLIRVGRLQLMRTHICGELRSCAKLNSGPLFHALYAANHALLSDLMRHYDAPDLHNMPGEIIAALSPFLDNVGIADPLSKVYVTTKLIPNVCFVLVALVIAAFRHDLPDIPVNSKSYNTNTISSSNNSSLPTTNVATSSEGGADFLNIKVIFDNRLQCLTPASPECRYDASALAYGVNTLLKQFHVDVRTIFLAHIAQYVRACVCDLDRVKSLSGGSGSSSTGGKTSAAAAAKEMTIPSRLINLLRMLFILGKNSGNEVSNIDEIENEDIMEMQRVIPQQLLGNIGPKQ